MPGARPPHRSVVPALGSQLGLSIVLVIRPSALACSGVRPPGFLEAAVCFGSRHLTTAPTALCRSACPTLGHFSNIVHGLSKAWPRWRSGSPGSVAFVQAALPPTVLRRSATPAPHRRSTALRCFAALAFAAPSAQLLQHLFPPVDGRSSDRESKFALTETHRFLYTFTHMLLLLFVSSSLLLWLVLLALLLSFYSASTLLGGNTHLECKMHTITQTQTQKTKTNKFFPAYADASRPQRRCEMLPAKAL